MNPSRMIRPRSGSVGTTAATSSFPPDNKASRMSNCIPRLPVFALLILLSLCAAPHLNASEPTAPAQQVLRATLANGLRVIIVRNTLAPVVATSVNYLVGSDEAPPGFRVWHMRRNT